MSPVGVLGGAFDPPHLGHLSLARGGIEHFGLERLLVRVVAEPGHKTVRTAAVVRLELARLAFGNVPEAVVELDPYARTVDSLEALGLVEPVFLLGADQFADFPTWQEPERVLELARLGVGTRPGIARERLDAVLRALSRPERVELFELDPVEVASSAVRALAGQGAPLDGLVPPVVAARIGELRLYRGA